MGAFYWFRLLGFRYAFYEALQPGTSRAKKPELKGKDIETTRKSCEKFKDTPTTIINFVEGTRFTRTKTQAKAQSIPAFTAA